MAIQKSIFLSYARLFIGRIFIMHWKHRIIIFLNPDRNCEKLNRNRIIRNEILWHTRHSKKNPPKQ